MLHVIIAEASGNVDLSSADRVRLPGTEFAANAAEGAVAQTTLLIDDEGGTVTVTGHRRAWAYEDTAPAGRQIIWTGAIGDREYGRQLGGVDEFVIGADRRISVALVESNTILSRRLVTGPDGDRPAETDLQRIAWLLSSNYIQGVANTYVVTSGGVSMTAADLRGQSAYDVLSDCANASNRNFHLVLVEASATSYSYALFYNYDYAAGLDSTMRLTNILADVDNSITFAVDPDMVLRRTPERVYSGMFVRYQGGTNYAQDITTGNDFAYRDVARDAINVRSQAAAQALTARYLEDADAEEDRITCRFVVPAASVNLLREGYRVQAKFSHLPGYSADYQYMRCVRRMVQQLSDDYYSIQVELAPLGVTTASRARVMRPNDEESVGAYAYLVRWDTDGTNFQPGDDLCLPGGVADPEVGLLRYSPQTGKPANGWEGLVATGDGLVSIVGAQVSCSGVVTGTSTITLTLEVNGVIVGTALYTDTTPGLHSQTYTGITVSAANFSVRNGDIIRMRLVAGGAWTGAFVIPAGVGECANNMLATGSMR